MRRRWKDRIIDSRATLPVSIALALCGWIATHALFFDMKISAWMLYIVYAVVGYLLFEFNTNFAFIKAKSPIQISFFLLLIACFPKLATDNYQLSTIGILIALFFLFRSYQEKISVNKLFYSFVFLSISSLLQPYYAWLIPIFWIGASQFLSLNVRSFAASIVGILLPYWLLWCFCYLQDTLSVFYSRISSIINFQPFKLIPTISEQIGLGYLLLLLLVATIYHHLHKYSEKLRTRSYISFLIGLGMILIIACCFQVGLYSQLLPILISIISLIVGHFFSVARGRMVNLYFIFVLVSIISLYLYNNLIVQ